MAISAIFNQTKFNVGDTVSVKHQFKLGKKTQSQTFEGIVLGIKGRGLSKTLTVRKIASDGIGVEKIWPLKSPNLKKITVKKKGKVRRAKLYYLRNLTGKQATKIKASKTKTSKNK